MKKIISFLCIFSLCILLASCGTDRGEVTTGTSTAASTKATTSTTSTTSATNTTPESSGGGIIPEATSGTGMNNESTSAGTVLTTLPLFARLDFGTKTAAEEGHQTSHAYIVSALTYNKDFLTVEYTEDSLLLTAKEDGTFLSEGETATLADSRYFRRGTNVCYRNLWDFALCFDDLITYDFDEELRSGYGTWANVPFNYDKVDDPTAWRGYHQYMKLRIKNPTQNDKIAVAFNNSSAYASTQFMVMSVGKEKPDYATYIYDLCYAATYPSGKGVLLAGQNPGNNWTWKQDTLVSGLRFHLLGSTCSYGNAFLDNQFEEGDSAEAHDKYAEYFNRLDTRELIKKGNTVEIDYIVFGSTPAQLQGYKSRIEQEG